VSDRLLGALSTEKKKGGSGRSGQGETTNNNLSNQRLGKFAKLIEGKYF
jgi:hypothetical protein